MGENQPPCDEKHLRKIERKYIDWRPHMTIKTTYHCAQPKYNMYRAHQAASQQECLGGGPKGSAEPKVGQIAFASPCCQPTRGARS